MVSVLGSQDSVPGLVPHAHLVVPGTFFAPSQTFESRPRCASLAYSDTNLFSASLSIDTTSIPNVPQVCWLECLVKESYLGIQAVVGTYLGLTYAES